MGKTLSFLFQKLPVPEFISEFLEFLENLLEFSEKIWVFGQILADFFAQTAQSEKKLVFSL